MSNENNDLAIANTDVTDFCAASGCDEFIRWDFGEGDCFSCKNIGQSYRVDNVPNNCNKLSELLEWVAAQQLK